MSCNGGGGARGLGGVITLVFLVFISVVSSENILDVSPEAYSHINVEKRSVNGRLLDQLVDDNVSIHLNPFWLNVGILTVGGLIAGSLFYSLNPEGIIDATGYTGATAYEYEPDPYARISRKGYEVANQIMRAAKKYI